SAAGRLSGEARRAASKREWRTSGRQRRRPIRDGRDGGRGVSLGAGAPTSEASGDATRANRRWRPTTRPWESCGRDGGRGVSVSIAGEQSRVPASIRVGESDITVWPEGQRIEPLSAPLMAITQFDDHARYHGALAATILEMERDPSYRLWIFQGGCGMKVRRPDQWKRPAADLIHGRALTFAHRVLSRNDVFTDDCWANVYRDGQYCMPHSHVRSNV